MRAWPFGTRWACGGSCPGSLRPTRSRLFQMPPLPVMPPGAPLAALDSLPAALPDLPPPSQYFSPAVILPSLPLNATAPLPASPALPLQAVKLPHAAGAPLAVPCRTIVPNVAAAATAIPLLAVAPQGVAALSVHPAVAQLPAQLPAQPVYQAAFPQMVPSDVPPSPLHTAQTLRATPPQPAPPTLPQPHLPSIAHLPEQAAPAAGVGSQVTTGRGPALEAGRPRGTQRHGGSGAPAPSQHLRGDVGSLGVWSRRVALWPWLLFHVGDVCCLPCSQDIGTRGDQSAAAHHQPGVPLPALTWWGLAASLGLCQPLCGAGDAHTPPSYHLSKEAGG